jgi:hypothetical protein
MSTVQQDIDQIANETVIGANTKGRVAGVIERVYNETKLLPVETVYPETTPEKAGQRFWYKGNQWHYMTQAEIDSTGWTGLVEVGFPAPLNKRPNREVLTDLTYPELYGYNYNNTFGIDTEVSPITLDPSDVIRINLLGYSKPELIKMIASGDFGNNVSFFEGAEFLQSLEDAGTSACFSLVSQNFSNTEINKIFTALPSTLKTATINVANNPGTLTCDPSIATSKGYIVIT